MSKYKDYIEVSPRYESVIDIDSDSRNPDMWQEYIIHEDMQKTLEAICDSLKYEDADKRRSFLIHGAYGTGKSYAAIVLKHLFEDDIDKVKKFLSNQRLISYRESFLSIRKKGEFLVIWKSQATDIRSGVQLLMTMEDSIRVSLKAKFGDKAYYGKKSLIAAAKEAVNDSSVNWTELFKNPGYALNDKYNSIDEFRADVLAGGLKAANIVARIYRDKGWGFFTSLDMFKDWIADIINGNRLKKTGIIFIWDEFTSYLRNNPNDDVLQPLSEFCKEQPFFMFLIVHKTPGWLNQIGEEIYERIIHRYHSLAFHVSESAAYELIGSSIITRAGMEKKWDTQKNILMKSISKYIADADNPESLRQLFPLHPMTLSLLAIVAQNFGASQRTLFRFMKDPKESEQNVGFIHYINNYGADDWRWLTADFLWDYFFTRESDVRNFSEGAWNAYQHYITKREYISGEKPMHVFKAAMLLIAIMSSATVSNLYSRTIQRKISATQSTLYRCFVGQLTGEDVDNYLDTLEQIGVLRLDTMVNGDMRLQIPYSGDSDVFDVRKDNLKKKYTRYELFKKNGVFAKAVENKIWDKNSASYGRIFIAACDCGTISIKARFEEVQSELDKHQYKFGILVVTISEPNQFAAIQDKIKSLAAQDSTGRFAVYLLNSPLTEKHLDRWYSTLTHSELAAEEGKSSDAERYADEADIIVEEWAAPAVEDKFMVVCGDKIYPSEYGANYFAAKLEREIIFGEIFTAAPELVVTTNTAFKKIQQSTALAGVQKKIPNKQVGNIVNGLKQAGVWDMKNLESIAQCKDSVGAMANFLLQRFSRGTLINLDILWQELQAAPYGYYNNMACGYILGFLLRHYVNSEFTWSKGDNNSWSLTEQNLATMITAMCKDELVNNYLSPGSKVWQKFRPYAQKIFNLQDGESVNETEARKYISKQCTENAGAPFWVLKYLPSEKFGGDVAKKSAEEIIDLFCDFMTETGDQDTVMKNIVAKFNGRGALRKILTSLFADKKILYEAFGCFVSFKCGELQALRGSIGLSDYDIFDSIHQMMQGQVSTWTESEVEEKLSELCIEYRAVAALNNALNLKRKNIKTLSADIADAFANMKVPATVIKKLDYAWFPTLEIMEQIAATQWNKISSNDKENYMKLLAETAQEVWDAVTAPKTILKRYMETHGHNCTEEELNSVYDSLQAVDYNSSAADFDSRIAAQLNKLTYTRDKNQLQKLWRKQSGFESVETWCENFAVPIQWIVDDETLPHIIVLKTLQDGKIVDNTALGNAVKFFESHKISALKDTNFIMNRFIAQIGESYRAPFIEHKDLLVAQLKANEKLSANVYSWANKVGEIRKTVDVVLRDKYSEGAKKNIKSMLKAQLRDKVLKLLDENPDLYSLFID